MRCTDAAQYLNAEVDNELGWPARLALRVHLLGCQPCRAALQGIRQLSRELATLPGPAAFPAIRPAVAKAAQGACQSDAPARARLGARGSAAAAVAILMAAFAVAFLARPSPSVAAYNRVVAAVGDFQTCHIVQWHSFPGEPRRVNHLWYSDGKFRDEGPNGVVQVYDGEKLAIYRPDLGVLFVGLSDPAFPAARGGFSVTALLQDEGPDADVQQESVQGPDGRQFTRFTVTHRELGERLVVLADAETDLPVSVEVYARYGSSWLLGGGTESIDFNLPIDPGLFVPNAPEGTTVIDRDDRAASWRARYEEGLGRAELGDDAVILRDFQVCAEGDVYAVLSGITVTPAQYGDPDTGDVIHALEGELTDDLGTTYVHVLFKAGRDQGFWFIPVTPRSSSPRRYVFRVVTRERERAGEWRTATAELRVADQVHSPLADPIYPRFDDPTGPDAFVFPRGWLADHDRADRRAEYWREQGDPARALRCYEEAIRILDTHFGRRTGAPHWWYEIGLLYEELGLTEEAANAYRRGLECDRGDAAEGWYVQKIRARLEDLNK